MGFRIDFQDVDADEGILLRLLRSQPSEVFGRPYGGYLLFLAGAADKEIVDWLSENMTVLDSLTGEDIAFAIFAKEFPVKLRTPEKMRPPRQGSIGSVSLSSLQAYGVSRACYEQGFGKIVDGEELTAITYAVDDIARGFGVLGELPCMIVLDGIPSEKFDVVPLDPAATGKLIPLLRKAIAEFRRPPTLKEYMHSVSEIVRLLGLISLTKELKDADELRLETITQELSAKVKKEVTNISNARNDLVNGKLRSLRRRLQDTRLLDRRQVGTITSLVHARHATLMQYSRTIAALRRLIDETEWPLDSETFKRYEMCDQYARTLLGTPPGPLSGDSPNRCLQLLSLLEESQQRIINEIMQEIPNEESLKAKEIGKHSAELKRLEQRLAVDYPDLEKWRNERLAAAMQKHNNLDHLTLSKIFAKLARKEQLVTIKSVVMGNASVFAGSIFKPDTLLKIWSLIT